MLGILTLATRFPRIEGDLGSPATFAFPVRIAQVAGASVDAVVHRPDDALLGDFIAAGRDLAAQGCIGIVTTCGFLVRWQRELAAALPVPVLTSALLQLPLVERCLPQGRRAGIITYSAPDLGPAALAAAGIAADTAVEGVDPAGVFARTLREGSASLDPSAMGDDVVVAAQRLVRRHADLGAIVLECANMPPYRAAVAAAIGLPVFDAAELCRWFYRGLAAGATGDM
jgi:hypothetical protein